MLEGMVKDFVEIVGGMDTEQIFKLIEENRILEESIEQYNNFTLASYDKGFSEQQIDELIQFFSTDTGKALVRYDLDTKGEFSKFTKTVFEDILKKLHKLMMDLKTGGDLAFLFNPDPDNFDGEDEDEDEDDDDEDGGLSDIDSILNKY